MGRQTEAVRKKNKDGAPEAEGHVERQMYVVKFVLSRVTGRRMKRSANESDGHLEKRPKATCSK